MTRLERIKQQLEQIDVDGMFIAKRDVRDLLAVVEESVYLVQHVTSDCVCQNETEHYEGTQAAGERTRLALARLEADT